MLCASLQNASIEKIETVSHSADAIELRLDLFPDCSLKTIKRLSQHTRLPLIFTFKGASKEDIFSLLKLEPAFVDIESHQDPLLFAEIKKKFPKTKRIASFHDYEKTPEHLTLPLQCDADIYKIATRANSSLDALRMLLFVKSQEKSVIGLCLGPLGAVTRILAPVVGSHICYAPLERGEETGEGQIPLPELLETYNYRRLNKNSTIFALIGNPVEKSPGHKKHNALFKNKQQNSVYVKLEVQQEELSTFFSLAKELNFKGFSVTMPLKEALIPDVAINTLFLKEGKFEGANTDGAAACDLIERKTPLHGKKVSILGAGGTALAIAKEAKKRGSTVTLFNRTLSRAQTCAAKLGVRCLKLEQFGEIDYDILIQATSSLEAIDCQLLREERVVLEVLHHFGQTPLLKAAKEKNCQIITGMELFDLQGNYQQECWHA